MTSCQHSWVASCKNRRHSPAQRGTLVLLEPPAAPAVLGIDAWPGKIVSEVLHLASFSIIVLPPPNETHPPPLARYFDVLSFSRHRFGYVMDVYMPRDKHNRHEHRGFGFVTFETEAAVHRVAAHGLHQIRVRACPQGS